MTTKRKNKHRLRARFVDHILEIWLDDPNPAYKGLLCSFDKEYVSSVEYIFNNLHKIPKLTKEELNHINSSKEHTFVKNNIPAGNSIPK